MSNENTVLTVKELGKQYGATDSFLLGMCFALMTDEQTEKMASYLREWIGEAQWESV